MKTIDNDIKTGQFKQIYLLYGEEQYLIRQYRDKLKHALAADDDTMNFSAFSGSDINQKEIIDLAETLPFFADRRLILIEDSGLFKKSAEELADYMSSIPETTYFVFVEKEIDKKTKMYKQVKKSGSIVEFPRQNETTLSRWIEGRIRRNGKNITPCAAPRRSQPRSRQPDGSQMGYSLLNQKRRYGWHKWTGILTVTFPARFSRFRNPPHRQTHNVRNG